ncbi:hypothetical protein FA15DRAFT_494136 [Coprinopsis marcescibilis]|uniref:Uncharacterized protein n=1 Tax=Coprinopsis marcescibilis TaxID=230819 RepID=A0A5C3KQV5_COPMA|nr:hypothetical protein FA15DRAFT_494136 [Coprinopsis marcescibilis]
MDGLPPRLADQIINSFMANYFNVACLVVLALEYLQTVERSPHLADKMDIRKGYICS